jgi:hypothetical protein
MGALMLPILNPLLSSGANVLITQKLGRCTMEIKSVLLGTAFVLATSVGSVQAEVPFSTLADVPAVKMSSDQMEAVRGTNHVIRLVQLSSDSALTYLAAIDATTAAGSKSGAMSVGNAQDRAKIVGMLP